MEQGKRQRQRRWHGPQLKRQILQACAQPGASVAAVALAHGINANLVHKWRRALGAAAPQARVLGLVECGTHVITAAEVAPYGHSEQVMAAQMLPTQLVPGMLVLADRNFYGFKLWRIACASGAKLAWRVKANLKLAVQQMLPDGSYLSTVFDSEDRYRSAGVTVRVVEYALHYSATPSQDRYRLLTNILDPNEAPALELAELYHERWEIESVFDEFKTHLRANNTVLRSKTPELVLQELWGLLLAHFAYSGERDRSFRSIVTVWSGASWPTISAL